MHVTLVIVICIVILGMVVEASLNGRVHAEYIRRRVHGQLYVKIRHEIPAIKHRRQPTPRGRPHIRQPKRSGGNIHI